MNPKLLVFSAMGIELVGAIVGAVLVGQWIDGTYQLKGIGVLSLSIGALVGWLIHIIILLKKLEEKESAQKDDA